MKTFNQFKEDNQYVSEGIGALVTPALKLGGKALAAYSAYSAGKNLSKGNYKKAGMDAVGVVPGGKVFKGIRALGGAKKLAKAGSFAQSATRWNATGLTPNAFAKGADKAFDVGTKAVTGAGKKLFGKNKNTKQTTITKNTNSTDKPKKVYTSPTVSLKLDSRKA